MRTTHKVVLAMLVALLSIPAIVAAQPLPQNHPAYLHALTDLRHARAHLESPDGGARGEHEAKAIHEIDEAINEIKKAAIDDGKDVNDHPPVDAKMDHAARIHRALELITKAHNDVSAEEDNRFAQGLQQRAIMHIDRAHHHAEEALAARP